MKLRIMKKIDYNSYGFKNKAVDKFKNGDDPVKKAKQAAMDKLNSEIKMLEEKGKGPRSAEELSKKKKLRDAYYMKN